MQYSFSVLSRRSLAASTLPSSAAKKTRLKCEIWEKWGATYGRNGWVGEKKYLRVEESRYRLQGLRRAALSAAALSAAGRAPFAPRHAARAGARPACRVRARGSSRRRSRGHTHWERSHQRARRRETPPEAGMLHAGGRGEGGVGWGGEKEEGGGGAVGVGAEVEGR